MEETPTQVDESELWSSAGPRLTAGNDGGKDDATRGEIYMLDAERGREDEYAPDDNSDSDEEVVSPSLAEDSKGDVEDCPDGSTPAGGQGPATCDGSAPGPHRSNRNPAPKVAWWEVKNQGVLCRRY